MVWFISHLKTLKYFDFSEKLVYNCMPNLHAQLLELYIEKAVQLATSQAGYAPKYMILVSSQADQVQQIRYTSPCMPDFRTTAEHCGDYSDSCMFSKKPWKT